MFNRTPPHREKEAVKQQSKVPAAVAVVARNAAEPSEDNADENLALDRLRRALAYAKEEKTEGFISLNQQEKCSVKLGTRATLRAVKQNKAALVVVPKRAPDAVLSLFKDLSEAKGFALWIPSMSTLGLGKKLGMNSPCQALVFSRDGGPVDAMASIREFILGMQTAKSTSIIKEEGQQVKDAVVKQSGKVKRLKQS